MFFSFLRAQKAAIRRLNTYDNFPKAKNKRMNLASRKLTPETLLNSMQAIANNHLMKHYRLLISKVLLSLSFHQVFPLAN